MKSYQPIDVTRKISTLPTSEQMSWLFSQQNLLHELASCTSYQALLDRIKGCPMRTPMDRTTLARQDRAETVTARPDRAAKRYIGTHFEEWEFRKFKVWAAKRGLTTDAAVRYAIYSIFEEDETQGDEIR